MKNGVLIATPYENAGFRGWYDKSGAEVSITFFTADNTDVKLCIYYCSPSDDRKNMYLDNLSLVKDEFFYSPDYIDDTFELNHNKNWRISDTARLQTSVEDGRLVVTPKITYGAIQSRPLLVKSGCYYEIAFDLDLSEVTDQYVLLVANTMPTVSSVDIKVEKRNITNFARNTYNPDEIIPTAEAKSIPSDKKITLDGATSFRDVIPAGSFVIHLASKAKYGTDIDIPFEFE